MVATAAATATAAADGGTAVRCCRVHVCSYTRGLTYVRLAAYRPRRTRPQNGVTQGGGVVRSPRRKRKNRSNNKDRAAAASIKQERDKENCGTKSVAASNTVCMIVEVGAVNASVGTPPPIARKRGLHAAPPGEPEASSSAAELARARARLFHLACIGCCPQSRRERKRKKQERGGERERGKERASK